MKRYLVLLAVSASSSLMYGNTPMGRTARPRSRPRIEAAQSLNRQGWDPYTLRELMELDGTKMRAAENLGRRTQATLKEG